MRYTSDAFQKTIKYTLMKIMANVHKIEESALDQYCRDLIATLPQNINSVSFAHQSADLISNDMTLSFHSSTQSQHHKEMERLKSELQNEIKLIYLNKLKPTINQISQEKLVLLLKEIKTMEFEIEKKQRSIMEYIRKLRVAKANQDKENQDSVLKPTVTNKPRPGFSLSV